MSRSEDATRKGVALANFDGSVYGPEYLSLVAGQLLVMSRCREEDGGWAWGSTIEPQKQEGWFPSTYWQPSEPHQAKYTEAPQLAPWQNGMPAKYDGDVRRFVMDNGLQSWIGDALEQLTESQRNSVMSQRLRVDKGNANKDNIVLSRIRDVASLPQKIKVFGIINNIDMAVLKKLGSQNTAVQETVMHWPNCKIGNVLNPSGVVVKRISDAVKMSQRSRSAVPTGRSSWHEYSSESHSYAHAGEDASRLPQGSGDMDGASHQTVEMLKKELVDALSRARTAEEALASLRLEMDELKRENEQLRWKW